MKIVTSIEHSDDTAVKQLPPSSRLVAWWLAFIAMTATALFSIAFVGADGWGAVLGLSPVSRGVAAVVVTLLVSGFCFSIVSLQAKIVTLGRHRASKPPSLHSYVDQGLGPLDRSASGEALYLDLMKRAVVNILYEDEPYFVYVGEEIRRSDGFELPARVAGEDAPTTAHSMVGVRRLDNLQFCIESALCEGVPGDIIETGVLSGGASIFCRAVLKAHHVEDRRVIACDTFVGLPAPPVAMGMFLVVNTLARPLVYLLLSIPSRRWHRFLFRLFQRRLRKNFPKVEAPGDDMVAFSIWCIRNMPLGPRRESGLEYIKSNFARYGLLDDQVVFLKGFFSDTLPEAAINHVAVLRLDGDTYESTMDVLVHMYPKLSRDGYCIIDDYNAFSDCRRAVDEYRQKQNITDEIITVDRIAVYWRKS